MAAIPATRDVYFYNSRGGDREYSADSMMYWLLPFFTTGVFNGHLQVTANGNMTVSLNTGFCNINGRVMRQKVVETFDLAGASGTPNMNRIDTLILRRDDTQRDIYPMVVTGAFSLNPSPPALVREGAIYDIKLADIHVNAGTITINQANIDDTRMYSDVCGWVVATVKEIDFSQIAAQFDDFFKQYKLLVETRYAVFLALVEGHEADAEAAYQSYLASLNAFRESASEQFYGWFNPFKTTKETEFNEWFQALVDTLTEEQVTNLYNLIDQHKKEVVASVAGVHGFRYWGNRAQVFADGGWVDIGGAKVGLTWDYIDRLNLTWDEVDAMGLTWDELENMVEKETA
ncbi:hypothetical protein LJC74_05680 [Eubacteriales bacterium OttesenSCG-928-A19]|nr:hypothetical protein [Eubacteriales bacterium OttesenSCG-928-A19]